MIDDYGSLPLSCTTIIKLHYAMRCERRPLLILKSILYALLANNANIARETFAPAHILRKIKGIIWKTSSIFRPYDVLAREINKF